MKRAILAYAASALLLSGGAALAANYSEFDGDSDKKITKSEFQAVFGKMEVFKKLDKDSDGKLSAAELRGGIGEDKMKSFNTRFGDDAFTKWDANNDSFLDENEFHDGIYTGYDADASGITEPEFGDIGDDFGDGGLWDV